MLDCVNGVLVSGFWYVKSMLKRTMLLPDVEFQEKTWIGGVYKEND